MQTILIGPGSAVRSAVEALERTVKRQRQVLDAALGLALTQKALHAVRPISQELAAEHSGRRSQIGKLPDCFSRPAPIALMRLALLTPDPDHARVRRSSLRVLALVMRSRLGGCADAE